jgi:large subunit ribosomal protein L25
MKLDDGTSKSCILKDITFDPITDRVTHFDLQGVAANEAIKVEVPVVLTGSAAGVRDGGVVDFIQHKLEIECFPRHLPEHLEINIADMNIGDSIHVRDLSFENVTILTSEDATVVLVAAPRVASETTETTGEEMQPELIGGEENTEGEA